MYQVESARFTLCYVSLRAVHVLTEEALDVVEASSPNVVSEAMLSWSTQVRLQAACGHLHIHFSDMLAASHNL